MLDWSEVTEPDHARMLRWYASLVAERRHHPALTDDRLDAVEVETDADRGWLVMTRGAIRVVCNLGAGSVEVPLRDGEGGLRLELAWDEANTKLDGNGVQLPGHGVAVLRAGKR